MNTNYKRLGGMLGALIYIAIVASVVLTHPYLSDSAVYVMAPALYIFEIITFFTLSIDSSMPSFLYPMAFFTSLIAFVVIGAYIGSYCKRRGTTIN